VTVKRGTVALDFDGVLNEYHGWFTDRNATRGPVPGALEFVQRLIEHGYDPVIFTCREAGSVRDWLAANGFPPLPVTDTKPIAGIYIDDRGYRFTGDFEAAWQALSDPPWWGTELWVAPDPEETEQHEQ
jgi:hypothetical protein